MTMLVPRATPCGTCPYRQDCPSGVWALEEYLKLPPYDLDTSSQPPMVFMCHDARDKQTICRGWLDAHPKLDLLALRLAASFGRLDGTIFDLPMSGTPVFESGKQAALHGMREITHPPDQAVKAIDKIDARRKFSQEST